MVEENNVFLDVGDERLMQRKFKESAERRALGGVMA